MRCERFILFLLLFGACSNETPAPSASATNAATATTTQAPAAPVATRPRTRNYDDAITWFRTAPSFQFVLDDDGVHAEGRMTRKVVGAESIEARVNGDEWRATAGALGVTWQRRNGGKWTAAEAPPFANRLFQRVTLAVDPQKKEGHAQFAGSDGTTERYRFTNANSGELHEVWVAMNDKHIERMKIGDKVDLKITP